MILDSLKNIRLYESLHPRFKQAFDFLLSEDLQNLPLGKTELDGTDLFVNVTEITGKSADEARMETHRDYIDIQVPFGHTETMGWIAAERLKSPLAPYDPEKDIAFFSDIASSFIQVQPDEFTIFFPGDGHQPGISEGTYRKLIVKVKI